MSMTMQENPHPQATSSGMVTERASSLSALSARAVDVTWLLGISRLQPAAAHTLTSFAMRSSSGNVCSAVRAASSGPNRDSSSLMSATSRRTIGLTWQRPSGQGIR
jgi:hypothetical protein